MAETKPWWIYLLIDPRTQEIRYVGVSTSPKRRFSSHLRAKDETPRCRWICELLALGLKPSMETVEAGNGDHQAAERRWIKRCRDAGCVLTNTTSGGNGTAGYEWTAEARAKLSASLKGRHHSPEWNANVAAAHKALNRKVSAQHKSKLSQVHSGKCFISEAGRKRIAEWARNRIVSVATRVKISAKWKGTPKTEAQRAKLSESVKGYEHSPEARAKMRDAWTKRKLERSEFPEKQLPRKCDCGECRTCYQREWSRRKRQADLERWRTNRGQDQGMSEYARGQE